jgi:hypothetical protein
MVEVAETPSALPPCQGNGVGVPGEGLVLVSLGRLHDLLEEGLLVVVGNDDCLVLWG